METGLGWDGMGMEVVGWKRGWDGMGWAWDGGRCNRMRWDGWGMEWPRKGKDVGMEPGWNGFVWDGVG